MRRCRVHVLGASGSGTTTLARALANHWSVPHADADDYFWLPTDPPYVDRRQEADRLALMHHLFVPRDAWVLSGSMVGWGDAVVDECDAIIFLTLDPAERLRRLEAREVHRRSGSGFDEGAWAAFMDWARGYDDPAFDGRSRVVHERWLADRHQPVLHLDSAAGPDDLLVELLQWEPEHDGSSGSVPTE